MPKTALIIPCYNEEERLQPEEYARFLSSNPAIDLLFVDDGSSDGTVKVMGEISERNPGRVACVSLDQNSGKAEAVRRGVMEAFGLGYEMAGYWDADNSTPLRLAPELVAHLEGTDLEMVMGSRVNILGKRIVRKNSRHYLGRFFATMASFILRLQIYDTQCGAKVFRHSPIMRKVFEERFQTDWTFDLEVIARTVIHGRSLRPGVEADQLIVEHPLEEWVDIEGSKLKASHGFKIARDLVTVYLRYHGKMGPGGGPAGE